MRTFYKSKRHWLIVGLDYAPDKRVGAYRIKTPTWSSRHVWVGRFTVLYYKGITS